MPSKPSVVPPLNRRALLQSLGGAAVSAGLGAVVGLQSGCQSTAVANDAGSTPSAPFVPDTEVLLRALPAKAQLLPGSATEVWSFQGSVTRGSASTLQSNGTGALGPTFRVRRGQRLRVVLENGLAEPTIVHWHGLQLPANMDGHPRFAVRPGQRYVYELDVRDRAGTYWYHAHPDTRTGPQVYRGLSGLFIVHDDEDDRLSLPRDGFDLPLVIQDRLFDRDNQLVYSASHMMAMGGWLGDTVLINGVANLQQRVATRPYRLRILNGSNSRVYRLAWEHGVPLDVIGTDGGLLERPVRRPYLMLGPAERAEIWADFSAVPLGTEQRLVSQAFDAGGMPMGAMSGALAQGAAMSLLTFKINEQSGERLPLPTSLRPMSRHRESDAINARSPHRIVPMMQHMSWSLSGRTFELDRVARDERVKAGKLEVWEFDNSRTGSMGMGPMRGMGMGMAMPHPMHLHGGQFQILRREGVGHSGYVDDGWKDTVLVMPGERAQILVRYSNHTGLFLYHCHNLEHEDAGMMRNFLVEA